MPLTIRKRSYLFSASQLCRMHSSLCFTRLTPTYWIPVSPSRTTSLGNRKHHGVSVLARLRGESESFEIAHLPLQVLQNNPSNVWVQVHSLRTLDGTVSFSGMKRAQDILSAWEKLAVLEEQYAQHRDRRRGTSSIYPVVDEASHPLDKCPALQTHASGLTTHMFTGISHKAHPASLINDLLSPSKPNYSRISRVPPTTQTTLNIA